MANAAFYYGIDSLTERATLSFTGVNPGAMAYNWETYDVVVGANATGAVMVEKLVASDDYTTPTDITSGIDTDNESQLVRLEYI